MDDRRGVHTAAVAALAFVPRMAWGLVANVPNVWDAELYERGARAIASGLGYSCFLFGPQADARVPTAYYPVGYPAYLAMFFALLGAMPGVVALAGAVAGAVAAALCHRVALRIATPRAALVAACAFALMPGPVMFAPVPMTETLWSCLLVATVWALARRDALRSRDLALAAFALAAATYVRPQALPLAVALPLALPLPLATRARHAVALTALTLALVAPWTVRNCLAIDGCALVSANSGANLAIGAVPRADGTYLRLTPADGCRGVVGEARRDRCWRRVAWQHIRRAPGRWLLLAGPKLRHTFEYEVFPVEYLDTARPSLLRAPRSERARTLLTRTWQVALALALVTLVPRRRALATAGRLAALTVGVMALTHAVFFGGDRYHLALSPLVLALASGALRELRTAGRG